MGGGDVDGLVRQKKREKKKDRKKEVRTINYKSVKKGKYGTVLYLLYVL